MLEAAGVGRDINGLLTASYGRVNRLILPGSICVELILFAKSVRSNDGLMVAFLTSGLDEIKTFDVRDCQKLNARRVSSKFHQEQ